MATAHMRTKVETDAADAREAAEAGGIEWVTVWHEFKVPDYMIYELEAADSEALESGEADHEDHLDYLTPVEVRWVGIDGIDHGHIIRDMAILAEQGACLVLANVDGLVELAPELAAKLSKALNDALEAKPATPTGHSVLNQ